jgi:hypothetical protein
MLATAFHEQVDVVGHDLQRVNSCAQVGRLLEKQALESVGHFPHQHRPAVFRTPHQVELEGRDAASVVTERRHTRIIQRSAI